MSKTCVGAGPAGGLFLLIMCCLMIWAGVSCLWYWGHGEISDPFSDLISIHPVFIFTYPVLMFIVGVALQLYMIHAFVVPDLKYLIDIIFYSVEIFEGTVVSKGPLSSINRWAGENPPIYQVMLAEYDYGEKKRGRKKFILLIPAVWADETDEQTKKWAYLAYDERPLEEPVKFLYLKRSGIIVELLHVIPGGVR